MLFVYIILTLTLLAILFFLIFGYILFLRVCKRRTERSHNFEDVFSQRKLSLVTPQRLRDDFDWLSTIQKEEISIRSKDGLKLFATLIKANDQVAPKGIIITFHGYRSFSQRDFCLQTRLLHNEGYHIVAVDQRSHGKSEGKYICYGIKECEDVVLWAKKISSVFENELPICLFGLSMGGATVLMSADLIEMSDTSVRCIVADCPFSSPFDIVSHVLLRYHNIRPFPAIYFIDFWCQLLAKISLSGKTAKATVSKASVPCLLIHGENDDFVPMYMSEDIEKASNGNARLIKIKNAKHSEAIFFDEKQYTDKILAFLQQHMKNKKDR